MSLTLQQGRGLSALVSGLLFLPLTGLISIGTVCAAPLAHRIGRTAVLALGQAVLAITFLAVAWASTAPALWPLVLALVPAGFSSGMLVATMTSQAIAAVQPTLHGAASAVFNTSRQIGAAIGIATFGPLLGATHDLGNGFITCAIVGAAATAIALLLTALTRPATAPTGSPSAQARSGWTRRRRTGPRVLGRTSRTWRRRARGGGLARRQDLGARGCRPKRPRQ
jgi:DHA2 family methylenomycin A resistance protein-like MFS transporter